jgi:hypothetical protein
MTAGAWGKPTAHDAKRLSGAGAAGAAAWRYGTKIKRNHDTNLIGGWNLDSSAWQNL